MTTIENAKRLVEEINQFDDRTEEKAAALKEKYGKLIFADAALKPLKNELRSLIEIASDTMTDAEYVQLRAVVKECYIKFLI